MESTDVLTFDLKNRLPVELGDYTLAMLSLAKEFTCFFEAKGQHEAGVKLYIKQIRDGSIVTDLIANAPGLLPIFDNGKTILEFALFLKTAYEWLLGKTQDKPTINKTSLENLSQIVEPVCKDNGSQLNISTTINNYGPVILSMNSEQTNAVQNRIRRELDALKEPVSGEHKRVVMYLYQARNDASSNAGDRAIIESISKSSVKTEFADDDMKFRVLHPMGGNPFEYAYVVDVDVETVHDKPVLYKVKIIHQSIEQGSL